MGLHVERLQVRDFRNYKGFTLDLHEQLTVIHGPNAAGKTNLIEALQLVTAGESFRKPLWNDIIREGAERARVSMSAQGDGRLLEVTLDVEAGKRRQYSVNGSRRRSVSGSTGSLPSVLFTPEDLNLVKGPSEQRRTAIDTLGEQLSGNYKTLKREYLRVLRQRNNLLKEATDHTQLEVWTSQLVHSGSKLMKHRSQLVQKLAAHLVLIHQEITGEAGLTVRYLPSWDRSRTQPKSEDTSEWGGLFTQALLSSEPAEAKRGVTLVGPHKDEIEILLANKHARAFASQGQQRSIALAWKLAEVDVIQEVLGVQPLLLLDDVMSELDGARRELLTEQVQQTAQTVMTTTNLPYFDKRLLSRGVVVSLG